MRCLFLLILAVSASFVNGQTADVTPDVWIRAGQETANLRIAALERVLNETCNTIDSKSPAKDKVTKLTVESLQRKVVGIKKQIWSLPRWEQPIALGLKVGAIGRIRSQIAAYPKPADNMTAEEIEKLQPPFKALAKNESVEVIQTVPLVQVFQILDEKSLLAKVDGEIVYVDEFDTSGKTDKSVLPDVFFHVIGTKRYQATVGSNTVLHLRPISNDKISELNKAITPAIKHPPRFRQWSDATKKFNVEAELVSFEKNTATLLKPDGDQIKLPIVKLSADDKAYINENLGAEKPKKRPSDR